jgi:periplasmic copper chaperone A
MRRLLIAVAATGLAMAPRPASAHDFTSANITITHPWIRATPGGATVAAAYLKIKTADGVADKLLSASSPVAGRAEVHTHIKDGDIMRMRRVESRAVQPGAAVVLEPSGDHVMLMDLKGPLKEGDFVQLKLTFEKAGLVEVVAIVEPIGAASPSAAQAAAPVDSKAAHTGHGEHKH